MTHDTFVYVTYNGHAVQLPGSASVYCPWPQFQALAARYVQTAEQRALDCRARQSCTRPVWQTPASSVFLPLGFSSSLLTKM